MVKDFTIVTIKDGIIQNRKAVKLLFEQKDGRYLVEISGADKRSNQQNRYYFGLVVPLIQKGLYEKGLDVSKEEAHEFLKARLNFTELVNEDTGEFERIPMSTTRLNKEGFSDYIQKIQRFAAEWFEIVIPDPGEQMMMGYDS